MTSIYMFAAQTGGLVDQMKATGEQFGFNKAIFISQIISFLIVAFLLKKFAYGPILKVLLERRERIEEGLKNADRIKGELAKTEAARQEILNKANTQANKLIEEARAAAAKVQETETQKAIQQAEQIIVKAREAAEADRARMVAELRKEIGGLVVKATSQVTGKILTLDDQKRLMEETNKQVAA
jgi:F-type H+-transporting ATPase subunit b